MKKLFFFAMVLLGFSFSAYSIVDTAGAFFMPKPFGGRIITPTTPGLSCPGTGPVIIAPVEKAYPAAPYYIAPGVPSGFGKAPAGSYILGLYYPKLFPVCFTDTTPPVSSPAYVMLMYGVSKSPF